MFEGLNITRKLKRQLGSGISMVLSVAMLVTGLPADLLGGITSVKADKLYSTDVSGCDTYVEYNRSAWTVSDGDPEVSERTTSWDFSSKIDAMETKPSDDFVIAKDYSACGVKVINSGKHLKDAADGKSADKTVGVKKDGSGLSVYGEGCIAIPLDTNTEKVKLSLELKSKSNGRTITIGTDATTKKEVVEHNPSKTPGLTEVTKNARYTYEQTYDSDYITVVGTSKWLYLTSGDPTNATSGETKFWKINIVETKTGTEGGGNEGGGNEGGDDNPDDPSGDDKKWGNREWNFKGAEADQDPIQNTKGEYQDLQIDASSGKFQVRKGNWALFNTATIKVPVDGPCKITVVAYTGTIYTVDGGAETTGDQKEQEFTYKGNAGYVDIVSKSASGYIGSIKTEHTNEAPEEKPGDDSKLITDPAEIGTYDGLDVPAKAGDMTWTFPVVPEDVPEDTLTIQNNNRTAYRGLKIDTTSSKFIIDAREGKKHVQITAGTKIQVPVHGNCEITVTAGGGNVQYAKYTVNGKAASAVTETFTYEGQAGWVDIISTDNNNAYIKSISIKHVEDVGGGGDENPDDPVIGTNDGMDEGTYTFGSKTQTDIKAKAKGLNFVGDFEDWGNSHGFAASNASSALELNLKSAATIIVRTCVYGQGDVTSSSGVVIGAEVPEESGYAKEYTIVGAKGSGENGKGKVKVTLGMGADGKKPYVHSLSVMYDIDPATLDTAKADVWDFGAEDVTGANNCLTADIINKTVYPNVTGTDVGTAGHDIPGSFILKDKNGKEAVKFVTDKTNNRLRTTNKALTRTDEKSLDVKDGETVTASYKGYLYSNNSSTKNTRLEIYLYEGDTLRCIVGSNGGAATYVFENFKGEVCGSYKYSASKAAEEAVFHAAENGWYKLYCTDEKLVCARITREHAPLVNVSGAIDTTKATGINEGYGIVFTNTTTGKKTVMTRNASNYSGILRGGYIYKGSLTDANGWVIDEGRMLDLTEIKAAGDKTNNLVITTVDQKKLTGKITELTDAEMKLLDFTFTFDEEKYAFEPVLTIDRTAKTYTLYVENGVEYAVEALNVNDSTLQTTKIQTTKDDTLDIVFVKKPTYVVEVGITGFAEGTDLSNAIATFTNIDETYSVVDEKTKVLVEKPYTYTFKTSEAMKLRDGRYSVKVTGLGNYAYLQGPTANVNVKGAAASTTAPFKEITDGWDFAVLNSGNGGPISVETIGENNYYAGLKLTGQVAENKTYLLAQKDSSIVVPGLKKDDKLSITFCYAAQFKINGGAEIAADTSKGSTSKFETAEYTVAADGDVTIACPGQTYFCSIAVLRAADKVAYAETLEVGKDKTYKTINAALAAVRKMERTSEQRVTIAIQPGDYEEMLDIDVPNVTLKNAAATPSTELKNKGVDIDSNAVRVTWYYGHGYTYYSMGPDCKYDEELLAVNKANGYASFKNPGSGTTNGSYWNATVTVQASGFRAEGIIFENSFNQYMSKMAEKDVIESQASGAKEGDVPRASMKAGDTTVQDKAYVERAAALAIYNDQKEIYFENCRFIGRQDTLYGGTDVTAAFYNCAIYGGTDYIFGGMTAVFAKCDLVFNTSENGNDVGYITAPQQKGQKGYLMYNCTVTSTVPGVDTASKYTSKAGYLGRPWQAETGEAVFYSTIIEATCAEYFKATPSMIQPVGWTSTLGGESGLVVEYDTYELAKDGNTGAAVDYSKSRAKWSGGSHKISELTGEAKTTAETKVKVETYLGTWDAFKGKDMAIKVPTADDLVDNMPVADVQIKVLANIGADDKGKGQIRVSWDYLSKLEAENFELVVQRKGSTEEFLRKTIANDGTGTCSEVVTGLSLNKTYVVSLTALKGKDRGKTHSLTIVVKKDADILKDPKYDLELKDGLKAGVNYPGGFSVMQDMARGSGPKTVVGVEYDVWVQGKDNASPNKGAIPTAGAVLMLDALGDGKLSIIVANTNGENKTLNFVDGTNGVADAIMKTAVWEDKIYEFDVKAGHKYYFYGDGTKVVLCGVSVQYTGEIIPSLDVTAGTDIPGEGLCVELVDGDEYTYTGIAIKPAIKVTNNGEALTEGVHYTVKYKNNVKAANKGDGKKAPTITVTGKGNLTSSNTTTFTINPKSLEDSDVVVGDLYAAVNTKITPIVVYNGVKLTAKDYTLSGDTSKLTTIGGDYKLTITAKENGNYTGTLADLPITVVAKNDLKKLVVDIPKKTLEYNGTEQKRDDIVVYEKGHKDDGLDDMYYDIVYSSDCVNAGTVKVTVIGYGLYTGSITKTYKISPCKASEDDINVDGITESLDFKVTGATFDNLEVSHNTIGELVEGKDYKVSYSGNKKANRNNKSKVTITFLGNYKGTKAIKRNFSIYEVPLSNDIENLRIVSPDKVYNGRPNTYASKPYVTIDGAALKASDYTVRYYKDAGFDEASEIKGSNKLSESDMTDGVATVYVKIIGKGNFKASDEFTYATTQYQVRTVSDKATLDLSKAKVTFYSDEARTRKVTKLEYTGEEVEPLEVKLEIRGVEVPESEYEVVFVNNVNKGKATAIITAYDTSAYGGSKTATYSIVSRNLKALGDKLFKNN